MRKRLYSFLPLFLFSCIAMSQNPDTSAIKVPWQYNEANDSLLGHKADIYYAIQNNSTTITNDLTWKYLSGKHIGNKERTDIRDNLYINNRFALDENYGLDYSFFGKNFSYTLNISHHTHVDAAFTGDLFKLVTEGNKQFAGRTANFDGSSLHFVTYKKFGAGIIKKISKWKKTTAFYSASVSYLAGNKNLMLDVPRGRLFTQQDGEYLDADFDFTFHGAGFDSKGNFNQGKLNGNGIGTDLGFGIQRRAYSLNIQVKDAGIIFFNRYTRTYEKDTVWRFDGINFNDIFHTSDSGFQHSADTLEKYVIPEKIPGTYRYNTPARISIDLCNKLGKKSFLVSGINYQFFSNYVPQLHVSYLYYITPLAHISAGAWVGGYGRFDLNISFSKQFRAGWFFTLQGQGLESVLSFNNTSGFGFMAKAGRYFGRGKSVRANARQAY